MASETKIEYVPNTFFTEDGADGGVIKIISTSGFKVKADVIISADSLPSISLEVKRVLSKTTLIVGKTGNLLSRANLSAYKIALNASVFQPEQNRSDIPYEQHARAVYEEEPTMATRSVLVNELGNKITSSEDGIISGLDVNTINKMINVAHDDIEILSKNENGDPLSIVISNKGIKLFSIDMTYDQFGDIQRIRRIL